MVAVFSKHTRSICDGTSWSLQAAALAALALTAGCPPRVIYEYETLPDAGQAELVDGAVVPAPGAEPVLTGEWVDVTGNLATVLKEPNSDCGALAFLTLRPDGALLAGVGGEGVWVNAEGTSWTRLGNSKDVSGRPSSILYDRENPDTVWLTTMYDTDGAIYRATDGETFTLLGNAHHIESLSVDFDDPERKTIVAGGHERLQAAYRWNATSSGWDEIGTSIPTTANNSMYPLVIDPKTYLIGCVGWGGSTSGIYRTIDGGESWELATEAGGRNPPLVTSDGTIYWAGDNENSIAKSTDDGETWTQIVGKDQSVTDLTPIELPDGRLVSLTSKYGIQRAIASEDDGATWKAISVDTPFTATGFVYHPQRKALYVWHQLCGTDGMSYAIARYDFDHEKK